MHLNHLNLPVPDVAAARDFFESYFHFTCTEIKGDQVLAVLQGTDGFVLVLMADNPKNDSPPGYPNAFHIGFLVDDRREVDAIYQTLRTGGLSPEQEPHPMRGIYGFYFRGPGNILIEVSSLLKSQTA